MKRRVVAGEPGCYWTGAERPSPSTGAFYHRMDGFTGYTGKGIALLIRCVRKD